MNGFSFPNNRWSFIYGFILSYIITLCFDNKYTKKERNFITLFIVAYTAISIIGIFCCEITSAFIIYLVQIFIAFFILIAIWYFGLAEDKMRHEENKIINKLYKNKFTIIVYVLSITSIIVMAYGLYSSYDRNYASEFIDIEDCNEELATQLGKNANYEQNITNILNSDSGFYRIAKIPHHVQNLSIYYNYASTECFLSIGNRYLYQLNNELADNQFSVTSCIRGLGDRTKITTLLGTKYYIADEKNEKNVPYGYILKEDVNGVKTYENQYPLSIGVAYTQWMDEEEYAKLNPVEKEDALLKAAVIEKEEINQFDIEEKQSVEDIKNSYEIVDFDINDKENILSDDGITTTKGNQKIDLKFKDIENSELYVYISGFEFQGDSKHSITATFKDKSVSKSIENRITSAYFQSSPEILLNLGYYDKAEGEITLKFSAKGKYKVDKIQILAVSMDSYKRTITELQKNQLEVDTVNNKEIKGKINMEDDGILQISTSYTSGWKAFVDGKQTETIRVNTAFIGIPLEEGEHEIYLKYEVPYLKTGIACSVIGIIMLIGLIVFERKELKKNM